MDANPETAHMLEEIEGCVSRGDAQGLQAALSRCLQMDCSSACDFIGALTRGMERSREDLKICRISLPEFLFAVDAFREGAAWFRRSGLELPVPEAGILIGVVEGEVHDLGKNIVSAVLEASGYRVIDPGGQLSRDCTLEAIPSCKPSIVALSAMMSTCIPGMQETIAWIRKLHPGIRVLVGGAALDADLAAHIGAHGYAGSAATVADEAGRLMRSL